MSDESHSILPGAARFWVEERIDPVKGEKHWAFIYRGIEIGPIHDDESARALQAVLVLKTWRNPVDCEPAEGENCIVWVRDGWGADRIIINVVYVKLHGWWVDRHANAPPTARVYPRDHVAAWAPALAMPFPPDEWGR